MIPAASKYRPDIDGLRCIAVLGVVLYHASAKIIPGGFVGVDIFFVISGFLITSILLKQTENRTLSVKLFYERRIKRIMPALFVVLAATLAVGFFKMTPWDFKALATSAQYTIYSFSNVHFNRVTGNYFDAAADSMPLLHTWSLGVEEQFYLGFPLILMVGMHFKWSRRQLMLLLGGLGVLSLGLCLWKIRTHTSDCFYLIPYRAWELMVGGLLALWAPRLGKGKPAQFIGMTGLVMIAAAMAFYGKNTLFPGAAALLPCVGAAMVIAAGQEGTVVSRRILGCKPFVWVGLISYSVYLWHWPLLAFQNYLSANDAKGPSHGSRIWIGLLSLPLGYLSWRFIEQPFRSEHVKGWKLFTGWAAVSAAFLAFVFAAQKTNGFEGRMSVEIQAIAKTKREAAPIWGEGALGVGSNPLSLEDAPIYGDSSKTPHIALWGDSHAYCLSGVLNDLAKEHGASFYFYGRAGSPPLSNMLLLGEGTNGQEKMKYTNGAMRLIEENRQITSVILMARWSLVLKGFTGGYGPAEKNQGTKSLIAQANGQPFSSPADEERAYRDCVRSTIARLRAAGKKIFLIYPWPEVGYDVPSTLAHEISLGHDPTTFHVSAKGIFFSRQKTVLDLFDSLPDGPDLVRIKPHEVLIVDGHIQLIKNGKYLYQDDNHLSQDGAKLIKPLLEQVFSR